MNQECRMGMSGIEGFGRLVGWLVGWLGRSGREMIDRRTLMCIHLVFFFFFKLSIGAHTNTSIPAILSQSILHLLVQTLYHHRREGEGRGGEGGKVNDSDRE